MLSHLSNYCFLKEHAQYDLIFSFVHISEITQTYHAQYDLIFSFLRVSEITQTYLMDAWTEDRVI